MARGRGSYSLLSACCVATPWVRRYHGFRLHCTVGVDKPFVVQFKIRSSVVYIVLVAESKVESSSEKPGFWTLEAGVKHETEEDKNR
jgi:hypothetical protein